MTSFWKTMFELGRIKLQALGAVGAVLGVVWVVGILFLWDTMSGAYAEGMPEPGMAYALMLLAWIVIGLAVYLWRDPHGIRSGGSDGVDIAGTSESKSD